MRKLIAAVNITLDGFMAGIDGNLDWHVNYWDSQLSDSLCRLLAEADTLLLGANTYRAFADYWPSKNYDLATPREDIVLAEMMNRLTKIVVSKTISNTTWLNSVVANGNLRSAIGQIKKQSGSDIILLGSRQLMQSLSKMKLIDRYELWIHPVTIGRGELLFKSGSHTLRLTDHQEFRSGIVRLSYQNINPKNVIPNKL